MPDQLTPRVSPKCPGKGPKNMLGKRPAALEPSTWGHAFWTGAPVVGRSESTSQSLFIRKDCPSPRGVRALSMEEMPLGRGRGGSWQEGQSTLWGDGTGAHLGEEAVEDGGVPEEPKTEPPGEPSRPPAAAAASPREREQSLALPWRKGCPTGQPPGPDKVPQGVGEPRGPGRSELEPASVHQE